MTPPTPTPLNKLYAIERDGNTYSAAFYEANGKPDNYAPRWVEVDRATYYALHARHLPYMSYAESRVNGSYARYDLDSQLITETAETVGQGVLDELEVELREHLDIILEGTGRM
jgi:hypothetical protein